MEEKNASTSISQAVIKGYIIDNTTKLPIDNTHVFAINNYIVIGGDVPSDYSGTNGFFEIPITYSNIQLYFRSEGYKFAFFLLDDIKDGETYWYNVSLEPSDIINSATVKGYVYDNDTNEAIRNALIFQIIVPNDSYEIYYINYMNTDSTGFYKFKCPSGLGQSLIVAEKYFWGNVEYFQVNQSQTYIKNIGLIKKPNETSKIYGYIKDAGTNNPIENVDIYLRWYDNNNTKSYYNYTLSDSNGYYEINVAEGKVYASINKPNYFSEGIYNMNISSNENIQIDFSLIHYPKETAKVLGFIKDENDNPVNNAKIRVYWTDSDGHGYNNYSYSNSNGFYIMNIAGGEIDMTAYRNGYFSDYKYDIQVNDNETINKNFVLHSRPEETSVIFGYVKDNETDEPIENAYIDLDWRNESIKHSYDWNYTYSDADGFYFINVAPGEIDINVNTNGYFYKDVEEFNIKSYEAYEKNIYLESKPSENALIKGFVKNNVTKEPIKDAFIKLYWKDDQGHTDSNFTYSDDVGYYNMSVAEGTITGIYYSNEGYFNYNIYNDFNISSFEQKNIDVFLIPYPIETSKVEGYVKDKDTNEPIENCNIKVSWRNENGNYYYNSTTTNYDGYYEINVAAGLIELKSSHENYFKNNTDELSISDHTTHRIDFSLKKMPPENSIIEGFIKDELGNPIQYVSVYLTWENNEYSNYNFTLSDSSGYYSFNVASGMIDLNFYENGYFSEGFDQITINENDVVFKNITLYKKLEENTIIKGYILNKNSNEPIPNAFIRCEWYDYNNHNDFKYTKSDENGYYEFKVRPGNIILNIEKNDFIEEEIAELDIKDNDTIWMNVSLSPEPADILLYRPVYGFYIGNNLIFPLIKSAIIFGNIDVTVYYYNVELVEFYLNDELQYTDSDEPFEWYWDNGQIFKHQYNLKVVGYSKLGMKAEDEIDVWKFF